MLFALRNYIQRHPVVSSEQLAREFSMSIDALEPLLNIWIDKGFLKKVPNSSGCKKTCGPCVVRRSRIDYYMVNSYPVSIS